MALAGLTSCVAAPSAPSSRSDDVALSTAAPEPSPASNPAQVGTFVFTGEITQGGWIRGQAPTDAVTANLGGEPLLLDSEGRFFAGFDRDAGATATLSARLADGGTVEQPLIVSPRAWDIERIDVERTQGRTSEEFWRIRQPELARIEAARSKDHDVGGWRQPFVWPVKGRISGRFGSQRIYRGARLAATIRVSTSRPERAARPMLHLPTAS